MNTSKILTMIGACMLLTRLTSCEKKQAREAEESEEFEKTSDLISNPISYISCLFVYGEGTVRFSEFQFKRFN